MIVLIDVYNVIDEALHFLYQLIEERMDEPDVNISATMPTWREHVDFVYRRPYRFWYLIQVVTQLDLAVAATKFRFEDAIFFNVDPNGGGELRSSLCIGYISATDRNEIGVVLQKAYRGRGYGPAAVKELMRLHKPLPAIPSERSGHWLANINPNNERSIVMFKKLGFTHIQNTYAL